MKEKYMCKCAVYWEDQAYIIFDGDGYEINGLDLHMHDSWPSIPFIQLP